MTSSDERSDTSLAAQTVDRAFGPARALRFAYADPPYLGSSAKRYGALHADAAEFDAVESHRQLIERLVREFPDGWALSMASTNLRTLLPLCPEDVRVLAWVKPYTRFFLHVNPAYAWEPVIVRGGRKRGRGAPTIRDWLSASAPHQHGRTFTGRKPAEFCSWLFEVLGMTAEDELVDLFPGSGAVGRAWEQWRAQQSLDLLA